MQTTSDLIAVRLGPLRGPVEALCERRKTSISEVVREGLKAVIEAEPDFKARVFRGFLLHTGTMVRLAKHHGILSRPTARVVLQALNQALQEVEKKLSPEPEAGPSKPFPPLSPRDLLVDSALEGVEQLVMTF